MSKITKYTCNVDNVDNIGFLSQTNHRNISNAGVDEQEL